MAKTDTSATSATDSAVSLDGALAVGACRCSQTVWRGPRESIWQVRTYDVITIARRGGFVLDWGQHHVRVKQGAAAVIPAGIQRRARQLPDCDAVSIATFNLHNGLMRGAATPFGLYDTPTVLEGAVVKRLLRLHRQTLAESGGTGDLEAMLGAHRLSLDVLELVLPHLPARPMKRPGQRDLTPLLDWLQAQLDGDVGVEQMAAFCDLSVSRFHRVFREATGETPHKYLQRHRLMKAAQLLRTTDLKLADIAEQLAFADQFHLSRLFKKEYGLSPSAFRKSAQVAFL